MMLRIAIWATVGALVVIGWTLYLAATFPTPLSAPAALVDLTCPIALLRHYPLSFYVVLVGNAATYALVGAVVEIIRRHSRTRAISN
jgi:hypothetical protein